MGAGRDGGLPGWGARPQRPRLCVEAVAQHLGRAPPVSLHGKARLHAGHSAPRLLWRARHPRRKAGKVLLVRAGLRLHRRHVCLHLGVARVVAEALLLQHAGQSGLVVLGVPLGVHSQLMLPQQLHALRI